VDATPPIFAWDAAASALLVFGSADEAARRLGAWREPGLVIAWDAEGRLLRFTLARRRVRLAGILPVERDVLVPAGLERDPAHAEDLRRALVASLSRGDPARRAALEAAPLAELVRAAGGRR
jgi:hypothetical protein